jgi:ribose/xylose/arabinose/galactoside ABC-type transport system permease subunit
MAWLGFGAAGLALSLRTGTPNLAIGGLAAFGGWLYADQGSIPLALAAVLGIGVFMALLTGLTGLPGWAVTLSTGGFVTAILISQARNGTVRVQDTARPGSYLPWALGFLALSIVGGVLFAIPAVRRFLSANRPAGGEAGAFSGAKLVGALVGIGGSSLLAGVAGVLQARYVGAATPYDTGLLVYALAAVLLGAVSPWGRRAGVFGVALAVVVVAFVQQWELLTGASTWVPTLSAAVCGLVGLLVIWVIELIGRRVSPLVTAPAAPLGAAAGPGYGPAPFAGYGPPPPGAGPPVAAQPFAPPPVPGPPLPPPVSAPPAGPPPGAPGWPTSPAPGMPPVSGPPVSPPGAPGWPPSPAPGTPPVSGPPVSPPPPGGPVWPASPPPQ